MFGLDIRRTKFVSTALTLILAASTLSLATPARADYRPPIITTTNPTAGTITGGELITVTGQNFQWVTGGKLGANNIDFTHWVTRANDGTWLKFRAPDSATTGLVDLTLYSEVNVTSPKAYTYTATKISSIAPNKGIIAGGAKVTIKGIGFGPMEWTDSSLNVRIGSNYATNVVRVSPTEITAVVPAGTAGVVDVVVSFANSVGMHYSNNVITGSRLFTYADPLTAPTITSVTPKVGPIAGGNDVTIVGTKLKDATKNGVFTFDGKTATVVSMNSDGTSAVVRPPAHAVGLVNVAVTTANGSATKSDAYEYVSTPTITSITPNRGVTEGGTFITISGSNFGAAGTPVVKVAGKLALCTTLVNSSTITAATRENVAGAVDVVVTSANGSGTVTSTGGFTYAAATAHPVIDSVTPNSGSTQGGNSVDIHTSGTFPAGIPNVMFGQLCALGVTRVDDHTIRATAPASSAGAKNVTLTFDSAYSISSSGYTYIAPVPAEIMTVNPSQGFTVGGTSITITGRGFGNSGTPVVTIGGVAATNVVRSSDTVLTATTPASATIGAKAVVVTPEGQSAITKANAFTYRAPVITSVTPNNGLVAGGTPVTIVGDGFGSTGTPAVTFAGNSATSIVRVDETTITAVTPAGVLGDVAVAVTPEGGTQISKAAAYTYVPSKLTPLIYNSTPQTGPQAGGVNITLTGANFRGTSGSTVVTIGDVAVTNLVINAEGTQATFNSPALSPGVYDISITTNQGRAWRALYTVPYPPTITENCQTATSTQSLNPDGGTTVTIYGNEFALSSGNPVVKLGGVEVAVTASGNTGSTRYKDFVTVTDLGGALGYVTAEIIPANNSGSVSLTECLYRHADGATIYADDKSIYFGEPAPEFTWGATGERGTDNVTSVTLMFEGNGYGPSATPPTASGTYTIIISDGVMNPGDIGNYNFTYINGTYTILGIPAHVIANDKEKVYGDDDPTFDNYVTGLQDGEAQSTVVLTFAGTDTSGASYGPSTTPPTNAGTYTITPSDEVLVSGNEEIYSFIYDAGDYIIHKRPVTITSVDQQKIYGESDPSFPWEFLDPAHPNLAYSDTLTGTLSRVEGENVGSYQQTIGTLADDNPNYDISYMDGVESRLGDLSINPKHISVTADDKSKIYGDNDPELTYSSAGFVGDDTLTGSLSRAEGLDVGSYAITQGTVVATDNYIIDSFTPGTLLINTRDIEITPYELSKIYGENDPEDLIGGLDTGYYISSELGLVYSDTFTGQLTRDAGENVNTYAITQGTVSLSNNYNLTFVTGKLFTINKRPIVLSATNVEKTYGEDDPTPFAYSVLTGGSYYDLVGGDTISGAAERETGENVDDYNITVGTLDAGSNYELSFESGKLTINPLDVTVDPNDETKTYGESDPVFTYTTTPASLPYGDTLSGSLGRDSGEDVNTYNITVGEMGSQSSNYNITVGAGTLTIQPLDITVTADAKSKQYGDTDPEFTYTTSPSLIGSDSLTGSLTRTDTSEDVGAYQISQGTVDGGANYNVTYVSADLTIGVRDITVVAQDKNSTYGDVLPANTVIVADGSSLAFSDALDSATFSYSVATPTDAGDYSITPSDATFSTGNPNNYNITYSNGTLTIDPLYVELTADNVEKFYGDSDPGFTYTTNPASLPNGDVLAGTLSRASGEDVNYYNIEIGDVDSSNANYNVTVVGGQLQIKPLSVRITPDSQVKTYGDDDPTFGFETDPSVLPNGETLSGSLGRTSGEDVGSYPINADSMSEGNSNYSITVDPATLTINALDVAVTADPQTKQYGDSDPQFSYTSNPSIPFGGSLSGNLTRIDTGESLGNYAITQGDLSGGSNINITYTGADLTIEPRDIEIVAQDQSVDYGSELPVNSYSFGNNTSLVAPDEVGSLVYDYSVVTPEDAGEYGITPSGLFLSTGDLANYNVTYTPGTLTINKVNLEVTADDVEKDYGSVDPTFNYTITGGELVNGDSTLSGSLDRQSGESAGDYTITIGDINTSNTNYNVTVVSGKLTIKPLAITLTADNKSKSFGDNNPTFTYEITLGALTNGDTSLSGSPATDGDETVGEHPIGIGDLQTNNPNYNITFIDGTLTIAALDLEVTVNNAQKYYGDEDPVVEYTFNPATLPNGDPIELDGATERNPGEALGEYNVNRGTASGGTNFNITTFTGGKLTIVARPLHVKADDITVDYGQMVPDNSYSFVDGTSLAFDDEVDGVNYTTSGSAPRHVGDYTITPSDLIFAAGDAANYDIVYQDGELVVEKVDLIITIANASSNWGEPAPAFAIQSTEGLVDGDELGEIEYTVDASTTIPVDPDIYDLDGTMSSLTSPADINDYNVTIVPATYQINGPSSIAIFPPSGPVDGGTEFTIYGSGFGFETADVIFDDLEATDVVVVDSNTITGVTPPHVKGPVKVLIKSDNISDVDLGEAFTYVPPTPTPTINFVYPDVVKLKGGTTVTVVGDNLCELDGTNADILIGGRVISGVTVSDDCKTLTFKTPTRKAGRVAMLISNGGGLTTYGPGLTYQGTAKSKQMSKSVLFKGDSPTLTPKAKLILKKLAKSVKAKKNKKIFVNGWIHHVKGQSLKKDKAFRKWLASKRAKNVAAYLKKLGVKGTYEVKGKGIHTYGNYKDRRAEIVIIYDE